MMAMNAAVLSILWIMIPSRLMLCFYCYRRSQKQKVRLAYERKFKRSPSVDCVRLSGCLWVMFWVMLRRNESGEAERNDPDAVRDTTDHRMVTG